MPAERSKVLIATLDDAAAQVLAAILFERGFSGERVKSGPALLDALEQDAFEMVLADHDLEDGAGHRAVSAIAQLAATVPVVVLIAESEAADGVAAVRSGAADFLCRPINREEALYVLSKVQKSVASGAAEPPRSATFESTTRLLGDSAPMRELRKTLQRAANAVATVLVRGESGTGKELVVRLLHELSPRSSGPLVKVHCAALPDQLLESELFGYERGAFTGAAARKPGRVELAQGGTLFLDEIGDISAQTQVKLLRILQDRQYERLGGTQTLRADVRVVTATHRDLEAMVKQGTFREDLFYRLNVVTLFVPPLRERRSDIETLALHFCAGVAAENGRRPALFDADALSLLREQPWPGNVRELQNFIERIVVLATKPRISAEDVRRELVRKGGALGLAAAEGLAPPIAESQSTLELEVALRKAERRALERALGAARGNKNLAARLLGISRRNLYYKLEEHNLLRPPNEG